MEQQERRSDRGYHRVERRRSEGLEGSHRVGTSPLYLVLQRGRGWLGVVRFAYSEGYWA